MSKIEAISTLSALKQALDWIESTSAYLPISYDANGIKLCTFLRQAIDAAEQHTEAESKRAALDAIIKSSEKRNEEWDSLSADEQAAYHAQNACPYCGGSGHKDDIAATEESSATQEPIAWMVYTLDGKSVFVTDNPTDFTDEHRALPLYTHPEPKREPLTDKMLNIIASQWHMNLLVGKDKADVMSFSRAIEAAHGIKGKHEMR